MKKFALSLFVVAVLVSASLFSITGANHKSGGQGLLIEVQEKNPWTNLEVNRSEADFQFAIVTDRTGGRRPGVFAKAVTKINLLQPEFVMSVGDLIQGYTEDPGQWALEWSEFESRIDKLEMPFFMCAGNHDISNMPMSDEWDRKFGRSYYHFVYRNTLFVVLNSEQNPKKGVPYTINKEQQEWFADVMKANADVRWTFVILHKPAWSYAGDDPAEFGWTPIESALQGRQYTVFSGHKHNYARMVRKNREYYMLATTGGGSNLSGYENGRFDHFVWVTMKGNEPVIANVMIDGIEDKNVRNLPAPKLIND